MKISSLDNFDDVLRKLQGNQTVTMSCEIHEIHTYSQQMVNCRKSVKYKEKLLLFQS